MENGYRVRRERNSKKIFKTVLVEIFLQFHRFCCSMYFLCQTLREKTANCFRFREYHQPEIFTEFPLLNSLCGGLGCGKGQMHSRAVHC
jgi:hypothetical protein